MFPEQQGFDLSSLSLSGVTAAAGSAVLQPGRYVCTIKSCKLADTKAKDGKLIQVLLVDTAGKGVITARLNIVNKSPEAQRIGLEQLKAMAVHCGNEDPDSPFHSGIGTMDGKTVGVIVKGETYQGEKRSAVSGFCDPTTVQGYEGQAAGSIGDDDIPF